MSNGRPVRCEKKLLQRMLVAFTFPGSCLALSGRGGNGWVARARVLFGELDRLHCRRSMDPFSAEDGNRNVHPNGRNLRRRAPLTLTWDHPTLPHRVHTGTVAPSQRTKYLL
ncbi:hypothetical protein F4802DRAFT_585033 [Xylaria palmicola]|nr:hypothetical protein F4802DRAFT_585033 [Xylaria palmicola]